MEGKILALRITVSLIIVLIDIYFSYSNYQSSMMVYYTNLKRFTRCIIVVEEGQTSRGKGN